MFVLGLVLGVICGLLVGFVACDIHSNYSD